MHTYTRITSTMTGLGSLTFSSYTFFAVVFPLVDTHAHTRAQARRGTGTGALSRTLCMYMYGFMIFSLDKSAARFFFSFSNIRLSLFLRPANIPPLVNTRLAATVVCRVESLLFAAVPTRAHLYARVCVYVYIPIRRVNRRHGEV